MQVRPECLIVTARVPHCARNTSLSPSHFSLFLSLPLSLSPSFSVPLFLFLCLSLFPFCLSQSVHSLCLSLSLPFFLGLTLLPLSLSPSLPSFSFCSLSVFHSPPLSLSLYLLFLLFLDLFSLFLCLVLSLSLPLSPLSFLIFSLSHTRVCRSLALPLLFLSLSVHYRCILSPVGVFSPCLGPVLSISAASVVPLVPALLGSQGVSVGVSQPPKARRGGAKGSACENRGPFTNTGLPVSRSSVHNYTFAECFSQSSICEFVSGRCGNFEYIMQNHLFQFFSCHYILFSRLFYPKRPTNIANQGHRTTVLPETK